MHLSKRLETVVSLVSAGNRVADVGCDHGYVPIRLVESLIAPSAIAADIRKGPLERAKINIKLHGLEDRIETRLSDGLSEFFSNEAETLIISGIGGLLLIRILTEGREKAKSFQELILSPQSDLEEARRFLVMEGYTIQKEHVLKEDGKYYFIFYTVPERDFRVWKDSEYAYGKSYAKESLPAVLEYLKKEKEKQQAIKEKLILSGNENSSRKEAVVRQLAMIEQRLDALLKRNENL